jgi:acetyltransferase-like isoleucine patch superfamily enzyme
VPKRPIRTDIGDPERVSAALIARCQTEIESKGKSILRRLFLPFIRRRLGVAELGEGFHWGHKLRIGAGSRIGRYAYLGEDFEAHGPIVIGDLCMVAAGCKIVGADHLYNVAGTPTRLAFPQDGRLTTTFGADVWIGQRVTIIEGLTIGSGAVIGSGAIVTKDVPPYAVVVGVPAKVIKWRFPEDEIARHHENVISSISDDMPKADIQC